jgi:hypothetical protein
MVLLNFLASSRRNMVKSIYEAVESVNLDSIEHNDPNCVEHCRIVNGERVVCKT